MILAQTDRVYYLLPFILSLGVIGNTSDFGSEEFRFEPWGDNKLKLIKEMKRIGLTKISELSDAEVPNNIPVGDYREGTMRAEPKVGECFWLDSVTKKNDTELYLKDGHYFRTSTVIYVISKDTFKTVNSIYKITEI